MNRLILDHFRRWSWVLAMCAVGAFWQGWFITCNDKLPFEFWILMISMWAGANLLMMDLKRGAARVVAVLPLTARQIGRSWWLATVAFPAVALAALLFLGALTCRHYHPDTPLHSDRLVLGSIFILVWLGSFYTAIQGDPFYKPKNALDYTGTLLISLLSIFMMFGSMLLCQNATKSVSKCALFFGIGASLTMAGWFRSERFVLGRFSVRLSSLQGKGPREEDKAAREEHRAPVGCGGMPFLIKTNFLRIFLMIVAMNALTALLAWILPSPSPSFSRRLSVVLAAKMGAFMSCGFIMVFQLLPVLRHLRYIRTLPISDTRLAAMLLAIPILPLAGQCAVSAGVVWICWGAAIGVVFLKSCVMILAPASLCVFFAVWRGNSIQAYVLMVATLFAFLKIDGWLVIWLKNPELPVGLTGPIAAISVLLALLLTRLAIQRGGHSYCVAANPLGNPPWGI